MAKSSKADTSWGDFEELSGDPKYRLIVRSAGPQKTGKNHFGLSGPGPIAVQYFDPGLEGTVEKFIQEGKEIRAIKYNLVKTNFDQDAALELREKFEADFRFALNKARTIQWDETEVWEMYRFAEFGSASDAPKNYQEINNRYRSLLQEAYDTGVNMHLIQKVKEKWKSVDETDRNGRVKTVGRPSGQYEPVGFKEVGYIVQVNLLHSWDKERGFIIKVEDCRQNMQIAGEEFENLTFSELGQLVFPDSTEDDWS